MEATIIDGEDLVYKYEQSNLVLQFTQKETKGGGDELAITAVDGQHIILLIVRLIQVAMQITLSQSMA